MTQQGFAGVLLDLDGVLVDSERHLRRGGEIALAELGYDDPVHLVRQIIGLDHKSGLARLRQLLGPAVDMDELDRRWTVETRHLYATEGLDPRPGARHMLDRLTALDMPFAIVTSSPAKGALRKLALAGLDDLAREIVSRDDVSRPKPDPAPYLIGAARLGHRPGDCLAFEDSLPGVQSAFAAGCTVVHVPDDGPADDSPAHVVAPDLIAGAAKAGLILDPIA